LGAHSYEVRVEPGLLARAGAQIAPLLRRPQVAVLTDRTVADLHLPALTASLAGAGIEAAAHALAPGEGSKSWAGLTEATEFLLDAKVERRDVVVALGDGMIGDLAGFTAAVLRRGVRFIQIPT